MSDSDRTKVVAVAQGTSIIFILFCIGAGIPIVIASVMWLRPLHVSEVQVERMDTPNVARRLPVTFNDARAIMEGLSKLQTAQAFHPNHESCRDGYRIRLKFEGDPGFSNRYLSVYRDTNRRERVYIVIPHLGEWAGYRGGQYTCPEFYQWVDEHLGPMFR